MPPGWSEELSRLQDWAAIGDMALVITRAMRERAAASGESSQTATMVETPGPSSMDQRTLDLGLAQAKGFVSLVAAGLDRSRSTTEGSNIEWQATTRG
jgi:hypothetical protein